MSASRNGPIRVRAAGVYQAFQAVFGFLFYTFATLNLLYHHTVVGMDPLQMVLVGTALELGVLIFEVPTGVVADVYSRRLSTALGCCIIGLGFLMEGLFPSFAMILVANLVWGGGYTFISGAFEAWLADELTAEGRQKMLASTLLRGGQWRQVGSLLGIGASTLLVAWGNLQTPLIFAGCCFIVLGPLMRLLMTERGFRPLPGEDRRTWKAMTGTLKAGLQAARRRPVLWRVLSISLFFGMFSEAFDRLWVVHLRQNFHLPQVPGVGEIFWFSLAHGVSLVLGIAVTQGVKLLDVDKERVQVRALLIFTLCLGLGAVVFGQAGNLVTALVCFWLVSALSTCLEPLTSAWMNSHIPSSVRATVLSLNGQANALGQVTGGPGLGAVGRAVSVRAALTVAGIFLLPALALYLSVPRVDDEEPEGEQGSGETEPPSIGP
ncbi:MAG: MFS transporter [Acidobacteriota bacterium]|nr:MFS transporter [Acidobacteriota bacterium]